MRISLPAMAPVNARTSATSAVLAVTPGLLGTRPTSRTIAVTEYLRLSSSDRMRDPAFPVAPIKATLFITNLREDPLCGQGTRAAPASSAGDAHWTGLSFSGPVRRLAG